MESRREERERAISLAPARYSPRAPPVPAMILAPAALLLATARLLAGYSLAFWVALGVPAVACALLAARAAWDGRADGPPTWRAWFAVPGWCVTGIVAGMAPWLAVRGRDVISC